MELTRELLDKARPRLVDAPREVYAAMLHLQPDAEDVVAALCENNTEGERTTWRTAWLTDGRLILCDASADHDDWKLGSELAPGTDSSIEAYAAPLSAVTGVAVTNVETASAFSGWEAGFESTIHLRDRAALTVPLFGGVASFGHREACEKFVRELLTRSP